MVRKQQSEPEPWWGVAVCISGIGARGREGSGHRAFLCPPWNISLGHEFTVCPGAGWPRGLDGVERSSMW